MSHATPIALFPASVGAAAISTKVVVEPETQSRLRVRLHRVAVWLITFDLLLLAFVGGVRLRAALWEKTKVARFTWDIQNGYHWGSRILGSANALAANDGHFDQGADWKYFLPAYRQLYDQVVADSPNDKFQLDYSPARLMVMSLWVRHVRTAYPQIHSWVPQYTYSAPLLHFNIACEFIAAVAACCLVRLWMRRDLAMRHGVDWRDDRDINPNLPLLCGMLAALLIWFNPAALADAHVWPQWDVWLLPFYLLTTLAASLEWWFLAGTILAFGCMFKGQLTMLSPLFLLWPLFSGRWSALLRLLAGAGFALALITCCWMVNGSMAWLWLAGVGLAALGVAVAARQSSRLLYWSVALFAGLFVLWPWAGLHPKLSWMTVAGSVGLIVLLELGPVLVRRRGMLAWLASVFAAGVFVACSLFNGSLAWQKVGFGYPTYHFPWMVVGEAANLAAILLAAPYVWQLKDPAMHLRWSTFGLDTTITIRVVLVSLYALSLVACGVAAARLSRRGDRRFLLVPGATAVLMFSLLPQMHERYLLWGAVTLALATGVSAGMTLIHLLLSLLAFEMIIPYALERDPNLWPHLHRFIASVYPGDAWAVLLCAAILLYQILKPSSRPYSQLQIKDS